MTGTILRFCIVKIDLQIILELITSRNLLAFIVTLGDVWCRLAAHNMAVVLSYHYNVHVGTVFRKHMR